MTCTDADPLTPSRTGQDTGGANVIAGVAWRDALAAGADRGKPALEDWINAATASKVRIRQAGGVDALGRKAVDRVEQFGHACLPGDVGRAVQSATSAV
ncbi:hypothetical protein [Saccharothrix sp. ST-888]|uniref:hypothetical protein n=1 Tax=Saccharothrix sp. ST-888 TaxID=1427391 RepID=UPI0005EC46B0|nr:hypothetical protein [Saccharothrix sp. ST-888]KJK57243.1 hypothetical protein UK12_17810 [Saccharothrix sp. ST-888]